MSGDKVLKKIKATPEMIKAGVAVLILREDETFGARAFESVAALAVEVFDAMVQNRDCS